MAVLSPQQDIELDLRARFFDLGLLQRVPVAELITGFNALARKYNEEHRHYHILGHLHDGFKVFDRFRHLAESPDHLAVSWYYHDSIYDIGVPARQNEERSAALLARQFRKWGFSEPEIAVMVAPVLSTTHDHEPVFNDGRLIVDIDLAGLGAPWEVFLRNNENVREEYRHVPEDKFREGNGAILGRFLGRTPLYYTPEIEKELGAQAKDNLRRWLNRP
jgi:predicted metal-dependent HD superfamily phosphohydrolase